VKGLLQNQLKNIIKDWTIVTEIIRCGKFEKGFGIFKQCISQFFESFIQNICNNSVVVRYILTVSTVISP
jgi:hypothetical protein